MAKPNYQYEKRQRDLEKKRKQEEKRQKRAEKTVVQPGGEPQQLEQPDATSAEEGQTPVSAE